MLKFNLNDVNFRNYNQPSINKIVEEKLNMLYYILLEFRTVNIIIYRILMCPL